MRAFSSIRRRSSLAGAVALIGLPSSMGGALAADPSAGPVPMGAVMEHYATPEDLGRALFFDTNLSANRTQACATCHDPAYGFADPRGMASTGDDGKSLGDRNAPTASYARFSPSFHVTADGKAVGGQFHDGRAATLKDQAGGPPLNPAEMGMKDEAAVLERLLENPAYVQAFPAFFGEKVLKDPKTAYDAMTKAIAAFEATPFFAPFDSKYDRYLKGEYTLTPEEDLGMTLFFSQQFTNCNVCHQLKAMPAGAGETFTKYEYQNIGVPANAALRAENGVAAGHVDHGLLENPAVTDKAQDGKYKTPTLRNVAVTGPYMHNGVFKDLVTVVRFYDKYNNKSEKAQINPETGKPWGAPEVAANISIKELEEGPALDTKRVNALVAFLKTLTDARYEHLLK